MSALTFARKKAAAAVRVEAEQARQAAAGDAGFRSPDSVRDRAVRMCGVLLKIMLTTGTAMEGFTAANAKLTAFSAEGAAVLTALGAFEIIDAKVVTYLAEVDALQTVEAVIAWQAQSRTWT
jgi:hypothetical protein